MDWPVVLWTLTADMPNNTKILAFIYGFIFIDLLHAAVCSCHRTSIRIHVERASSYVSQNSCWTGVIVHLSESMLNERHRAYIRIHVERASSCVYQNPCWKGVIVRLLESMLNGRHRTSLRIYVERTSPYDSQNPSWTDVIKIHVGRMVLFVLWVLIYL